MQMMTQIPYLQRWILFFVFYICVNPHLLICFGHISTNERLDVSFQVPLLHLMYDVSTVCKYFGTGFFEQAWYFQQKIWNCTSIACHPSEKFLVKLFIISPTVLHFYVSKFLIFCYILTTVYRLLYYRLVTKALSVRKALSMKQHIKALVGTRKFLSEFCLEVLSIEFDFKFLSFVSFKRFSRVKSIKFVILYFLWHETCYQTLFLTVFLFSSFYISSSYS